MSTSLKSAFASIVSLSVVVGLAVSTATPASAAAPDKATAAVTELLRPPRERLRAAARLGHGAVGAAADRGGHPGQLRRAEVRVRRRALVWWRSPTSPPSRPSTSSRPTSTAPTGDGWTFDASATGSSVTIDFTREVTQDAGLDIRDEDGTITLSTGTGIVVKGTLKGSFTLALRLDRRPRQPHQPVDGDHHDRRPAGRHGPGRRSRHPGRLGRRRRGHRDYHLSSTVVTAWANPDNDALESLAYDNPATAAAARRRAGGRRRRQRPGHRDPHGLARRRRSWPSPARPPWSPVCPSVGATVTLTSAVAGAPSRRRRSSRSSPSRRSPS